MGLMTLLLLAVALSMDAFAVAVCKGLAMQKITLGKAFIVGVWFGFFQFAMPMIGYALGIQFVGYVQEVTPWIAFILLALIGVNMIRESREEDEEDTSASLGFRIMLMMAVATSIDALAIGVTFACQPVCLIEKAGGTFNTFLGAATIGVITCILSMLGVKVGNLFGTKYKAKAELAGGIVLVLLGLKSVLGIWI